MGGADCAGGGQRDRGCDDGVIDVGEGTKEGRLPRERREGKDCAGGCKPGAVQELAVGKFRAAGIVSYAQTEDRLVGRR